MNEQGVGGVYRHGPLGQAMTGDLSSAGFIAPSPGPGRWWSDEALAEHDAALVAERDTARAEAAAAQAAIKEVQAAILAAVDGPSMSIDGKTAIQGALEALASASTGALDTTTQTARTEGWDACLDAIEEHELNTVQAREGNPYRVTPTEEPPC